VFALVLGLVAAGCGDNGGGESAPPTTHKGSLPDFCDQMAVVDQVASVDQPLLNVTPVGVQAQTNAVASSIDNLAEVAPDDIYEHAQELSDVFHDYVDQLEAAGWNVRALPQETVTDLKSQIDNEVRFLRLYSGDKCQNGGFGTG
jgi:hypothetical protein